MPSKVYSAINEGIDGVLVFVETDIYKKGLPKFFIIGLPDNAVRESSFRVKSAINNSGFFFPRGIITVNLAPANQRKTGSILDTAIAVGILKKSGQIRDFPESENLFIGELSLDGKLQKINGVLPIVLKAKAMGVKSCFIPKANTSEASIVDGIEIIPVGSLQEIAAICNGKTEKNPALWKDFQSVKAELHRPDERTKEFGDIAGQFEVKRAIEIAVTGRHNLLMIGPPGSGKTMLASRLPALMPELTFHEALETTKIYSSRGLLDEKDFFVTERPFRSPHHSASSVALIGGGSSIHCGEISLAHNGVLFLDEFTEFEKNVIQALREPLENRSITVSRASGSACFPADLLLVAAMNPCPCGFLGDEKRRCLCSRLALQKYYQKISGPILDRIDIHINVPRIDVSRLNIRDKDTTYTTEKMQERISRALEIQKNRSGMAGMGFKPNSRLSNNEVYEYCGLSRESQSFLNTTIEKLGLSLRAYFKILKLARTIADLESEKDINLYHLSEAVQYRILDRYQSVFGMNF